jgi:hypothetical protein
LIRPRATELMLTPSFCRRPAVDSGDGPALSAQRGLWAKMLPHLESHQDLRFQRPSCYCCTTGQKIGVARLPEGNRATIYCHTRIGMWSGWKNHRALRLQFIFSPASRSDVRLDEVCIHRLIKCHALARRLSCQAPGWSCRTSRDLKRGDNALVGTWLHGWPPGCGLKVV